MKAQFNLTRVYIAAVIFTALLLGAMAAIGNMRHRRYTFEGERLYLVSVDTRSVWGGAERTIPNAVQMRDSQGNNLHMAIQTRSGEGGLTHITTLRYMEREIIRTSRVGVGTLYEFSDGTQVEMPAFIVHFTGGGSNIPQMTALQRAEYDLLGRLLYIRNYPRTTAGTVRVALVGLATIAMGLLGVIFPEKIARRRARPWVRDSEPTDLAIFVCRATGVLVSVGMLIIQGVHFL